MNEALMYKYINLNDWKQSQSQIEMKFANNINQNPIHYWNRLKWIKTLRKQNISATK